jgi:hypothetical protein
MNFSKWTNILKLILLKIVEELERRINEKNGVDTSDSFSSSLYTSLKFIVLEQADGMVDEVVGYTKKQIHSISDLLALKVAQILGSLVYILVVLALFMLAFLFLMITLAIYLGNVFGQLYLGFLVTSGILILVIFISWQWAKKTITQRIKSTLVENLNNL